MLRGILWGMPAAILIATLYLTLRAIDFTPSAVSSRWVSYSIVLALIPVALAAAAATWTALRWLLLALWPGQLGIFADPDALTLRLGPFGTRRYPADQLDIRYPYELIDDDDADGGFEAYLPEEQQRAQFLPRITHTAMATPLNRELLRFTALPEPAAVRIVRPVLDVWRKPRI